MFTNYMRQQRDEEDGGSPMPIMSPSMCNSTFEEGTAFPPPSFPSFPNHQTLGSNHDWVPSSYRPSFNSVNDDPLGMSAIGRQTSYIPFKTVDLSKAADGGRQKSGFFQRPMSWIKGKLHKDRLSTSPMVNSNQRAHEMDFFNYLGPPSVEFLNLPVSPVLKEDRHPPVIPSAEDENKEPEKKTKLSPREKRAAKEALKKSGNGPPTGQMLAVRDKILRHKKVLRAYKVFSSLPYVAHADYPETPKRDMTCTQGAFRDEVEDWMKKVHAYVQSSGN